MVNWTDEQYEAIHTSGQDVLVAAAAGSGKTAVLVERIIQKLLKSDETIDIDSLLVVTFTNAAAQEMRTRIGQALERELEANPDSNHLKKQLSLLQRASISTLHSFCLEVIRQYAYLLDIDPGFRIANNMEIDLLQQDVMEELFEEWYGEDNDQRQLFFEVVDRFSSDRSDEKVESLLFNLYTFAMQNPWPEAWLDQLATTYEVPTDWTEADLPWLTIIKQEVTTQLEAVENELEEALNITRESDGPYHYADNIDADWRLLNDIKRNMTSFDTLQSHMQTIKFGRLSAKKVDCDQTKKDACKTLRNRYKKRIEKLQKDWFMRDLSSHVRDMQELAPVIKHMTELVKAFKQRFTEYKREKGIVDFSDLEHDCLSLLLDHSSRPFQPVPSFVSEHYKAQFNEVLVDEYQDTNYVQETILRLITDQSGPGNMFMVGDVKQSIYRFRHAEPALFIDKYKRYNDDTIPAKRIDLARNFRSREQVLTGINYVFRQILDERLGEIQYDQDAELIYANQAYDTLEFPNAAPEFLIIDRDTEDEEETDNDDTESFQELEKAQLEGRAYAEKIKGWIGSDDGAPLQVLDKGTGGQRDVQYRDIVILLRSMTWASTMAEELQKQGIPVYAEVSSGYFEAIEVKVIMSFLKVIDNPRQDIPLASVLHSPIVGFNEEELTTIRLANRRENYYDALIAYMKQATGKIADRVAQFLEQLETFRIAAQQGALSELIWQIYRETGYYDFVGGMPGGRQRQANLRALYDRARGYEQTSFRGLFRFLRFIERMEERGDDLGVAKALSEQEDVVRIMTIHSSKGLEFPVVIAGALGKDFNTQDLKNPYLLHKDLGFATKFIDPVRRITYPTLLYRALKSQIMREQLAEEMRVLYVALTRAKEKLVMVANVPSFAKKQEEWEKLLAHADWVLPEYYRLASPGFVDWIGAALIRHQQTDELRTEAIPNKVIPEIPADASKWRVEIKHGSAYVNLDETEPDTHQQMKEAIQNWQPLDLAEDANNALVEHRLSYRYPYQEAQTARAKQTVTEIKRARETKDVYSDDQFVQTFHAPIRKRPKFMQKDKTLSAPERGTAMHTVMQHIPLEESHDRTAIQQFVEKLVTQEILTKEAAEAIDVDAIAAFFFTDIGKSLHEQVNVYREVPFSLALPARSVYPTWQSEIDEKVLVQGVIDCVIPDGDGWIILDYKTDHVEGAITPEVKAQLAERYRVQMGLYREALEKIWKQPVKAVYLYFFAGSCLIQASDYEL